jgi:hypothetical protein
MQRSSGRLTGQCFAHYSKGQGRALQHLALSNEPAKSVALWRLMEARKFDYKVNHHSVRRGPKPQFGSWTYVNPQSPALRAREKLAIKAVILGNGGAFVMNPKFEKIRPLTSLVHTGLILTSTGYK